jgi:hypothetical protein
MFSIMFLRFLWASHDVSQVLDVFPKAVPNSTSLYPISFAQSFPLHLQRWAKEDVLHIETVTLGKPPKFKSFLAMGKSQWPIAK